MARVRGVIAALDGLGIDRQARRIDVGEHRPRAGHHDGERGVGGRQRRRDDLVAGADAERAQDQRDRVGAGADADGVRGAGRRGELALERFDFRAEDEPAAGHDPLDRGADVGGVLARRQRQRTERAGRSHRLRRAPPADRRSDRKCCR